MRLDGRCAAAKLAQSCLATFSALKSQGFPQPNLAILHVGDGSASALYIAKKQLACQAVGAVCQVLHFASGTAPSVLKAQIEALNQTERCHGMIVQLPLPFDALTNQAILNTIAPEKDVDGLTSQNLGRLFYRPLPDLRPCTPKGITALLNAYEIPLKGKRALVLGRSALVGQPVALELLAQDATVTIAHRASNDLKTQIQQAEVVVVAIGQPKGIPSTWFAEGSTVIDVGIHPAPTQTGHHVCGDIDWQTADRSRLMAFSPVPGGVGPMTVASLIDNLRAAYVAQISGFSKAAPNNKMKEA